MGVNGLWKLLKAEGLVTNCGGEELAKHVEDKTIAIDISTWLLQAVEMKAYQHDKIHIRIVFERLSHWLRMGALPVVVLDGEPPPEKSEERRRRCEARLSRPISSQEWAGFLAKRSSGGKLSQMNQDVKELLEAMGLPVIQADGEAEQVCAKLNELQLVDGVASNDGDSLLLGARVVYRNLRLHTELNPKTHGAEICDMKKVEAIQLPKTAILALALLSGADLICDGVRGVGDANALTIIRVLQRRLVERGESSDSPLLLDLLREVLAAEVDEALIAQGGSCQTCQNCRHGDVRKKDHGPNGCIECKTHATKRGGSGEGGCQPWHSSSSTSGDSEVTCPCKVCSRRDERILHMLAKKAAGGGEGKKREYLLMFDRARKAYEDASRCMTGVAAYMSSSGSSSINSCFRWGQRPSYDKLKLILGKAYGEGGKGRQNIARKLLPLLLEFDARNCGPCLGDVKDTAKMEVVLQMAQQEYGLLFVPAGIDGLSRVGGVKDWRYVVSFEATGPYARSILREAGEVADNVAIPIGDVDDSKDPVPSMTTILTAEKRAIRKSLIDKEFPKLVEKFQAKASKQARPKKKAAEKPLSRPLGITLHHFFSRAESKQSKDDDAEVESEDEWRDTSQDSVDEASKASSFTPPSPALLIPSIGEVGMEEKEDTGGSPSSPSLVSSSQASAVDPPPFPPQVMSPRTPHKANFHGSGGGGARGIVPSAPRKAKRSQSSLLSGEDDDGSGVMNLNAAFKRVRTRRSSGPSTSHFPPLAAVVSPAAGGGGQSASGNMVIQIDSSSEKGDQEHDGDDDDDDDDGSNDEESLIDLTDLINFVPSRYPSPPSSPAAAGSSSRRRNRRTETTTPSNTGVIDLITPP